jgi:hypothetical protein
VRTIGAAMMRSCYGVCVDDAGRVYATDREAKALLVFNSASGAPLATIPVTGNPVGVTVTHRGQIAVTTRDPKQLLIIE